MNNINKAVTIMIEELEKAKKMPVGTVSNGRKKVAEGKWVPVTDGKKKTGEDEKPKSKDKKPKSEEKKSKLSDENKTTIRNALKKMASILADALSGKDVVQPTGQALEETGKSTKKNKKPEKKDEKDKNKK